jgi:ABC-type Fe3+-hydroxamate transport system substrate-binding protein
MHPQTGFARGEPFDAPALSLSNGEVGQEARVGTVARPSTRSGRAMFTIAIAVAVVCAACGKNSSSTTEPSATSKTETFSGTVQPRGTGMNTFSVAAAGQVTATLTAAGPPATVAVGLGLGTPGDSVCGVIPGGSVITAAGSSAQLAGIVTPGSYCVTVYDVGNQTGAITYSVTVVHN